MSEDILSTQLQGCNRKLAKIGVKIWAFIKYKFLKDYLHNFESPMIQKFSKCTSFMETKNAMKV